MALGAAETHEESAIFMEKVNIRCQVGAGVPSSRKALGKEGISYSSRIEEVQKRKNSGEARKQRKSDNLSKRRVPLS